MVYVYLTMMACKNTGRRIAFSHNKESSITFVIEKRGILFNVLKMEKCFIFG